MLQGFCLVCGCTCAVYVPEGVSASCLLGTVEDCRLEERVSRCTAVPKRVPLRTQVAQAVALGLSLHPSCVVSYIEIALTWS